tara:strand:- start:1211 stop:1339 length:129 start_codon:yes stop_codon:yes gene_type:complete
VEEHSEQQKELMKEQDSKVDAFAAVGIILTLTAMTVFWVSSQ